MKNLTIKKRLFISNLLMIVIPAILGIIVAGGMVFAYNEITKKYDDSSYSASEEIFYDSMKKIDDLVGRWSKNIDLNKIENDVNKFNEKHEHDKVSLSIYKDKELLYSSPLISNSPILDTALSQDESHVFIMDNIAMYRKNVGGYSAILMDTNFNRYNIGAYKEYRNSLFNLGIIMFLFVIGVILITNRFLARFVFKGIIRPLDILAYGVHQIRDGNLDYHINYNGKDEFADICSDFNEMAQRLLDSVNTRQKDETNRKELIAGISHDLRTPLTSIKAYVEGIETGVAATPEVQKRYLNTIKNKTDDLEHIVNKLFLFSKLDIGEFPLYLEKIDIAKELSSMINTVSDEYEKKGLSIKLTQNIQHVYVNVDIVQLRNAVINVLENSVKYKDKEHGQMKITCLTKDKYVKITLTDNGPGVSDEAIEKIFDVFYRSDPSRSNPSKGSGLGLAITAKILERLGGLIYAENVTECGLAIIMMLPKV